MGEKVKKIFKIEDLLNNYYEINHSELSIRTFNVLHKNGIVNILDLIQFAGTEDKMKKLRGAGEKTIEEIKILVRIAKEMVANGEIYWIGEPETKVFTEDTKIDDPIKFLEKRGFNLEAIKLIEKYYHFPNVAEFLLASDDELKVFKLERKDVEKSFKLVKDLQNAVRSSLSKEEEQKLRDYYNKMYHIGINDDIFKIGERYFIKTFILNSLKHAGIETVKDLLLTTKEELLRLRNLGKVGSKDLFHLLEYIKEDLTEDEKQELANSNPLGV